jgi:hypothetical protein
MQAQRWPRVMAAWDFESDVETHARRIMWGDFRPDNIAEFGLEPASIVDLRRLGLGSRSAGESVTDTRTSLCNIEARGSKRLRVACFHSPVGLERQNALSVSRHYGCLVKRQILIGTVGASDSLPLGPIPVHTVPPHSDVPCVWPLNV